MKNINTRPIIIIGKMGVGKSTVLDILEQTYSTKSLQYKKITTYTSRERRYGEPETAYHFISNDEFDEMAESGELAEYYETELWGDRVQYGSKIDDYKIEESEEGAIIKVIILNPSGMKRVSKILSFNCSIIYLKAKEETLVERCIKRGTESKDEIDERLADEAKEFEGIEAYCDLVVNCDHSDANQVANIIDRYVHYDLY